VGPRSTRKPATFNGLRGPQSSFFLFFTETGRKSPKSSHFWVPPVPPFYPGTGTRSCSKWDSSRTRWNTRSGHCSSYSEPQNRVFAVSDVWNQDSGPFFGIARKALTDALGFMLGAILIPQRGERGGLHQPLSNTRPSTEPTKHRTPSKPRVMGYSTDARLADYSIPLASTIIYQHRSSSRNSKLDTYSRCSENRPGKGGMRIDLLQRSGMRSRLRQPSSELAAKAPYWRYQQHGWNAGYRKVEERCRSVPKRRNRWTGRMPFRAGRWNGLTERSARLPFRAEVPERVDRKVREDTVPSRAPGQMSRKVGNLKMEMGCLHRKVRTRHQTQDVKSPPEYGWHSTAIRCHDLSDTI